MGSGPSDSGRIALQNAYRQALASGVLDSYRTRRWQRGPEFASWLTQDQLAVLTAEQALTLYRASGGRRSREFGSNPIEEIRDSVDFLLFDTIKLEGRFDECASAGGGFKLEGAGKEFVSYLLCLKDPNLFALWNPHSDRILRRMGIYPRGLGKGNLGMAYMDILEALQRVRQLMGLSDFRVVDEFAYAVTRPVKALAG